MRAHFIEGHLRHRMRRPFKAPQRHCKHCGRFCGPTFPFAGFKLCEDCLPAAARAQLQELRLGASA